MNNQIISTNERVLNSEGEEKKRKDTGETIVKVCSIVSRNCPYNNCHHCVC